ncbi:hypothetical protein D3C71_1983050 [compost metagenome]
MEITEVKGRVDINRQLLGRMNALHTTQLIIGQSRKPLWLSWFKESLVHYLLRNARHMDMLIVADFDPNVTEPAR